jgi:light-regulated signal transduction histidine kinase (bacteriophytochrome)
MDLIAAVKEDLEIPIKEKNATIEVSPLPVITGNHSEFRQLFQNLISNSLKFSIQGTRPHISILAEDASAEDLKHLPGYDISKQYLSIKVTDNGIGFYQEYADKIFIIFQRLHGRDEYQGTGIGLAICKKITEKYGGTIYARSVPGKGATFAILLPKMYSPAERAH